MVATTATTPAAATDRPIPTTNKIRIDMIKVLAIHTINKEATHTQIPLIAKEHMAVVVLVRYLKLNDTFTQLTKLCRRR